MTEWRHRNHLTKPIVRYPFNEAIFDQLSDATAWLLGLIWSDGNLDRTRTRVCSKDRDLMEDVADLIGQPSGVRPKNGGRHWQVNFSSRHTAARLRELGLTEVKSFTIGWPRMPEVYSAAFVRGLFDGDGCVYLRPTRRGQFAPDIAAFFCGASTALGASLHAWLQSHGVAAVMRFTRPDAPTFWNVTIVQQAALRRLYDLMYGSAGPWLQRKRTVFEHWLAAPRRGPGRPCRR